MAPKILTKLIAGKDPISSEVPVAGINLVHLVRSERSRLLLRLESYYRCSQHAHKLWDFYGCSIGIPGTSRIESTGYIPMKDRLPSATMDLAKVIVDRLTALVFGGDHMPMIKVEGDADAEDFARELAKASKLSVIMAEARSIGGATGSVALSWGFVDGKPRIEVHRPAFIEVLEWADWPERKPAKVLKVYSYNRRVWSDDGRQIEKTYYYARYWDDQRDITWDEIPEVTAKTVGWTQTPYKIVRHDAGICPVYWAQNLPDSSEQDGISDYEGQMEDFDEIDILLSSTTKGTILNVDPTLVVHDLPGNNPGVTHKGSYTSLYSEKGAEYLELKGSAVEAALKLAKDLRQYQLDKASVVIQDPEKAGGGALSAVAMKTRFLSMLAKCDVIREQYGCVITKILADMLDVSRRLSVVKQDENGAEYWGRVDLPMKTVTDDDGQNPQKVDRHPGQSSDVTLAWPPYFPPTLEDKAKAVETAKNATGGQQVISHRTAVQSLASMFSIENPDDEMELIQGDEDARADKAREIFDGGPRPQLQGEPDDDEDGE